MEEDGKTESPVRALEKQVQDWKMKVRNWRGAVIVLVVLLLLVIVALIVFFFVSRSKDMLPFAHHSIHDHRFEGEYSRQFDGNYVDDLQIHESGRISMIGIHGQKTEGSFPVAWKNGHEGRFFFKTKDSTSVALIVKLTYQGFTKIVQFMEESIDCGGGSDGPWKNKIYVSTA